MALYRKHRPATFAEVVGQEHVTGPLCAALDAGRIGHAYLFSGPRGCGKTSSARILARSLNCAAGPTSRPCGSCASCVALAPGGPGSLDVIELDAASHGGVDDTRELRDRAFYAPADARYRVFIVDEAHMVTTAGFNALLTIVEEPPEHLIFVFATTEPDKVLPTIRSRTHHYPFRLLPPATMRQLLDRVCAGEAVQVDDAVFPLVVRAGGGSPRDTLSVLDQLLAGAGPEGLDYARAAALLGVTDVVLIDEAVRALSRHDGAALFGVVDRMVQAGHDPRRFTSDLLERMRDLILVAVSPNAIDEGLVTGPADVLERIREQAGQVGLAAATRYAELLHAGLGEMRGTTAGRLLLEVICARMVLPAASDSEAALLQRVERLERRLDQLPTAPGPRQRQEDRHEDEDHQEDTEQQEDTGGLADAASPQPAEEPVRPAESAAMAEPTESSATAQQVPEAAGGLTPQQVTAAWSDVRAKVRELGAGAAVHALLSGGTVAAVEGATIVLVPQHQALAQRLSQPANVEFLRAALRSVLGRDLDVRWAVPGHQPAAAPPEKPVKAAVHRRSPQESFVEDVAVDDVAGEDVAVEDEVLVEDPVDEQGVDYTDYSPVGFNERDRAADVQRDEIALELLRSELGATRLDG